MTTAITAPDAAALAALETQARRLDDIASRLTSAAAARSRSSLRASASDTWIGPARLAFDLGSARFQQLLEASAGQVDQALAETRRAISTLGGWR